jgi:hypothetical protein
MRSTSGRLLPRSCFLDVGSSACTPCAQVGTDTAMMLPLGVPGAGGCPGDAGGASATKGVRGRGGRRAAVGDGGLGVDAVALDAVPTSSGRQQGRWRGHSARLDT